MFSTVSRTRDVLKKARTNLEVSHVRSLGYIIYIFLAYLCLCSTGHSIVLIRITCCDVCCKFITVGFSVPPVPSSLHCVFSPLPWSPLFLSMTPPPFLTQTNKLRLSSLSSSSSSPYAGNCLTSCALVNM